MQSGIKRFLAQSPPPITLPALATAILIFFFFFYKILINVCAAISADDLDAL